MQCRQRCEDCPLQDRPLAPGFGKPGGVTIVGEAPGQDEARKGRPFTGPSGQLLRDLIKAVGVDPNECFFTNAVICHPPGNKTPTKDMIDVCRGNLIRELEEVQPSKIFLVGGSSLASLTPHLRGGNVASITKARGLGLMLNVGGREVYTVPSWHPAFVIRQEDLWRDLANDFYKLITNERPKPEWKVNCWILRTYEELKQAVLSLRGKSILSCDLETNSLDPFEEGAMIESIGFGYPEGEGSIRSIVIPRELVQDDRVKEILAGVFLRQGRPIVFHNGKFDLQWLWKWYGDEIVPPQFIDTMLMTFRQDERSGGTHQTHRLKTQARVRYDIPDYAFDFEKFFRTPVDDRDYESMYQYHAMDCEVTLQLYFDLMKELEEESPKFVPLGHSLDYPGCIALSRSEFHGVLLDIDLLQSLDKKYTELVGERAEKLYEFMGSKGFETKIEQNGNGVKYSTLNSAPKMISFFFDTLKCPGPRTTEKEPLLLLSTQIKAPEIKDFIEKFLDYRLYTKAIDTFVRGLIKRADPRGYIHPDFSQIGASTNRLSCVAEGTLVEVVRDLSKFPKGVPIEDVKVGDLAYSYTEDHQLVLRRVLSTMKQGVKKIIRLHWRSAGNRTGYLDVTSDHKIRLTNRTWCEAGKLRVGDRVVSLGRNRDVLFPIGVHSGGLLDHRFIFSQVSGYTPEEVHHRDGNHFNNELDNLEGITVRDHRALHGKQNYERGVSQLYRGEGPHPNSLQLTFDEVSSLLERSRWSVCLAAEAGGYDFEAFKGYVVRYGFDLKDLKKQNRSTRPDIAGPAQRANQKLFTSNEKKYPCKKCGELLTRSLVTVSGRWGCSSCRWNHIITKVEVLDQEVPVYDLMIEETHNFIAGEIEISNCRNPNVQNIPWLMGKDIRNAFLAPEGWVWVDADESQLELRVAAFVSQDEKMLSAYWDRRDLHREVAAIMFRKLAEAITEYERYLAKYVDFGILYGRGAHAIATGWEGTYAEMKYGQKKWTVEEAQYFIDEFLGGFPQLHDWIKSQHRFVRENGYVETYLGHRRRFPYMTNRNVASIERQAVNSPIQGFASQITFSGLTRASNRFVRELPGQAHILMTVHDSIGGVCRPDVQDKYIEILKHEMETPPVEMNVPLKADFKVGRSWGEAKGE